MSSYRGIDEYCRHFIDNTQEFILSLDQTGMIIFVNHQVLKLSGDNASSWCDQPFEMFLNEDDQKNFLKHWDQLKTSPSTNFSVRLKCNNRGTIWLQFEAVAMRVDSQFAGALLCGRDITDQKLLQKKLTLFKQAVDSSSNAISMSNFHGGKWYKNTAFQELFGDTENKPIDSIFLDKTQAKEIHAKLQTGNEFSGRIEMINAKGATIQVMLRASPIKDSHDKTVGYMGLYINVSTHIEAQKRIRVSEESYKNLYETSLAGLWRTRKSDGKFLKANLTVAKYLGVASVEELITSHSSLDFYQNQADREELLKQLEENNGVVTEFVLNFRLSDGEHRTYMVSCRDYPDEGYLEGVVTDITAQKHAENALQELEEDLRTTLNSIGDAVIATDIQGIIVRMNPAAETLTGWKASQAIGSHLSDVFVLSDPVTKTMDSQAVQQILTAQNTTSLPEGSLLNTKNGTSVLVSHSSDPIVNSHQVTTGVVLVFRDITHELWMEKTLRYSENRFRSMAELLPVGIFETDKDINLTYVNSQGLAMFGYTQEDIRKGIHGLSIFDDESRPRAEKNLKMRLAGKTIRVVEYTGVRKCGQKFPVLFYITLVRDDSNDLIGLRGALIDISDRKRTEEELRESEDFSSNLLQNSPHAIVVLNDDASVKYVNPAFENITGYDLQMVEGLTPPYPWWPAESHNLCWDSLTQLMNDRAKVKELLFQSKDGREFWIEMSAARIFRDDDTVKNYICSWVEITERKQMEEKLRRLSLHDSLTGLYNRTFFEEEIRRHKESRLHPVSVVICDIDGLKLINETMGHQAGDELLQKAAEILKQSFRKSDIVARIGGDEFAVILPMTSALVTRTCCNRIKTHLKHHNQTSDSFHLSISVGYAVGEEIHTDLEELYRIADHNMYREKLQQSHSTRSDIVKSLIKTMEDRDYISNGHLDRLQDLVIEMCKRLEFPDQKLNEMRLLCRFHDLGIVSIPEHILFKKTPLTQDEMKEIRGHCEIGYRIALSVSDLAPIADFILKHHECWNGEGYPLGLKGEEIPLESRVLAVADALDAMISERPYKTSMNLREACEELRRCSGEQFDPNLVDILLSIIENPDSTA